MTDDDTAESGELRRWRLVARLADALGQIVGDWSSFVTVAADILAAEIGDLATVVVLSPPGADGTVAAVAHVDPTRNETARRLLRDAPEQNLVTFVEDVGRAGPTVVTESMASPDADYDRAQKVYTEAVGGVTSWARAPIRHGDQLIGALASARDAGSPPHSSADRAALAAAAYSIGLRFDALAARHAETTALERWESIFATAAIGMSVVDSAGVVQAINQAACTIFGRDSAEIVGHGWDEFAYPDDIAPTDAQLRALTAREMVTSQTMRRLIRPDGEVRWVRTSRTVSESADGTRSVLSQFNDITDQYEAEKDADRFAAVVHSSPDFVAMADLDSNILFVNAAGRAMTHLPEEVDVRTTRLDDYAVPDAAGEGETMTLRTVRQFGNVEAMSALRDWHDGTAIPVWASTFLVHDVHTGEPIAVATVRRDMRDQLAAQRTLEATVRQRSQLLGELLAAEQNERERIAEEVHDESVQLLAAAHLRLQLLANHVRRDNVEAAGKAVNDITDLVVSALDQLRILLADLQPTASIGGTIADSLRIAAGRLFAGTSVTVTIEGELTEVPLDVASVLDRGAREALSNARRHSHAEHVAVRLRDEVGGWSVEVQDDGVGLPDEVPRLPGHLGLRAMVSRIEALGGECTVKSGPGGGTRVTMRVPLGDA